MFARMFSSPTIAKVLFVKHLGRQYLHVDGNVLLRSTRNTNSGTEN